MRVNNQFGSYMNFFFKVLTIQGLRATQKWIIEHSVWYEQVGSEDEVNAEITIDPRLEEKNKLSFYMWWKWCNPPPPKKRFFSTDNSNNNLTKYQLFLWKSVLVGLRTFQHLIFNLHQIAMILDCFKDKNKHHIFFLTDAK